MKVQNNSGFTLIETMVALAVLAIGIISLYTMQVSSMEGNSYANQMTEATNWTADQVEQIMDMSFQELAQLDFNGDGDGTDMDANEDGIDDSGAANMFGLNDYDAATADGSATSADGKYSLFWNVAVDIPLPNTMTVRVFAVDNTQQLNNPIMFTYIKNSNI